MFGRLVKKLAVKGPAPKVCRCRPPRCHRDCAYCGIGGVGLICGVCKENGIDGKVIRGTSRVVCSAHKPKGS